MNQPLPEFSIGGVSSTVVFLFIAFFVKEIVYAVAFLKKSGGLVPNIREAIFGPPKPEATPKAPTPKAPEKPNPTA